MSCPLSALASIAALTAMSPIGGMQISPPQPMDKGEVPLYNPSPDISAPANANTNTAKKSSAKKSKSKKADAKAKKQPAKKHKKLSSMKRAGKDKGDRSNQKAKKTYNKKAKMTSSSSSSASKKTSNGKESPPREAKCDRPAEKAPPATAAAASSMRTTNYGNTLYRPSFPAVLMGIMSAPHNAEYITFLSDEQRIIIVHPDAVAQKVLPMHFEEEDARTPTYEEFLGLFKVWGFEIMNDPQYPQVNVYKHPMFRKGDWEACLNIKMPKAKENSEPRKQGASLQEEPVARRAPTPVNVRQAPSARALLAQAQARAQAPLAGERSFRSPQTNARSVTPPENVLPSPALGVDEAYRARSQSLPQQELARRGWNGFQEPASQGWNGPQEPASSRVWNGPQSMTQDPAVSRGWMDQSSALERKIAATAEARRSLSGPSMGLPSLEELATKYPAEAHDLLYRHGGRAVGGPISAAIGGLPAELEALVARLVAPTAAAPMMPRSSGMGITSLARELSAPVMPPSGNTGGMGTTSTIRSPSEGLTDAQVDFMTRDVVSHAMAALQGIEQQRRRAPQPAPRPSHHSTMDDVVPKSNSIPRSSPGSSNKGFNNVGNNIVCGPSPSSSLDAMTEAFLERSNARRMRSRPVGIMGTTTAQFTPASRPPNVMADLVDARARALLLASRQ